MLYKLIPAAAALVAALALCGVSYLWASTRVPPDDDLDRWDDGGAF